MGAERESLFASLTLRELYEETDRVWKAFCDTSLEERREWSGKGYSGDSEACVLWRKLRELADARNGRERDFEADLRSSLGEAMKDDMGLAVEVYGALCNVDWEHDDGSRYGASWRSAGGLVNEIVNPEDEDAMGYCNFYCSGGEGTVSERVSDSLGALGWKWRSM